jgi:hypothetical protein
MTQKPFKSKQWDDQKMVTLSTTPPDSRLVYVAANGSAKLVFHLTAFIIAYRKEISDLHSNERYLRLVEALQQHVKIKDEIEIYALADERDVPLDFVFNRVVMPKIEKRQFCLFDVASGRYVSSYALRSYGLVAGPLAGRGGEEHMLPNGKSFWVSEWIS